MEKFQIQNCIDWNIRARDVCLADAKNKLWPSGAKEAERNARRHQRNIDQLNKQL